ncbi:hypothetical protein KLP40_00215 [Hymenobacter sp. NST-14]|uniref:hypothetical protein n=1 Tax=Hymenobacter piscis TaxID=2839984 RepID=UPI001C038A2C|nr:hypothetical protein [Hymenobacter piscis]MBT9391567.1 hypothetical protein [Hymenobacter piscis]
MKITLIVAVSSLMIGCNTDTESNTSASVSNSVTQPIFRPLNLNNNRVHLQVPKEWTHLRDIHVFGPDCAVCSGSEYEYAVGTPDSTSLVSVSVTVFPAGDNQFRNAEQELSIAAEKDPQAIMVDAIIDVAQQTSMVYFQSWRNRRAVYFAVKKIVRPYRTLSVYVQTPKTADNMRVIKKIMRSVEVETSYMTEPLRR